MKFKVSSIETMKKIIVWIAITLAFLTILMTDSIIIHVFVFIILSVIAIIIVKFDFYHPYMWFSPLFTLYSIAHPVLLLIGDSRINTYSKELMLFQLVGFSTFLVILTPKRVNLHHVSKNFSKINEFLYINKYIYLGIYIFLIIAIGYISQLGHQGKKELFGMNSIIVYGAFRIILVFFIVYAIGLIKKCLKNEKKIKYILISSIPIFLLFLYSGERDLVLRLLIVTFYILYSFDSGKRKIKYIFFSVLAIISMPFLNAIKYIGLGRGINKKFLSDFLSGFLRSDFIAASTNLQILIDSNMNSYFAGQTLLIDIFRSFDILGILPSYYISSGKWFDSHFYSHTSVGMGFTLVGEGYINFGTFGVVLVFVIISGILKLLYNKSDRSLSYYLMYLFSIPIYIYSIRGDLSNLLSPLFNQIVIGVILIKLLNNILAKSIQR